MYDKEEEKKKQIAVILLEILKLKGMGFPDCDLLHEFEYIQNVLKTTLYDWEKVADYMIGLWENYVSNSEVPEDMKEEVNVLTHQSVDALRELAENRRYLKNCNALIEQLIFNIKEKSLNFER